MLTESLIFLCSSSDFLCISCSDFIAYWLLLFGMLAAGYCLFMQEPLLFCCCFIHMQCTHIQNRLRERLKMESKSVVELDGRTYKCKNCKTHLALDDDIVSRDFHCRSGKAYLFSNAVNITVGPQEEKMLITGMHTVADIFCCGCEQIVGWKYVTAHKTNQKYKEGKFILEIAKITDGLDSELNPSISSAEDV